MNFSEEQIQELARDARLTLTPEEVARYASDLQALAELASVLLEIPMPDEGAVGDPTSGTVALREDLPLPCPSREALLRSAAHSRDGYLVVPRAVED